ncbi:MAG: hypothetical protein JSU04_19720 [Bdellovibrionales bacterium]|nr:hypothetical protein [Bdellovibrionales bacterium]
MSDNDIPKTVRDFVFEYIDSVEQLEILLLLESDSNKSWSLAELNGLLRSNINSVEKRISLLLSQGLIIKNEDSQFSFFLDDVDLKQTIHSLADIYKVHRYRILEMIFSPMKKSRDLAEAFRLSPTKPNKGDSHG